MSIGQEKEGTKELEDKINQSDALSSLITVLKKHRVMPLQDNISPTVFEAIKGQLALMVKLRNTVRHTYKMELDENLSNRQMIFLIDLSKTIIKVIENEAWYYYGKDQANN